MMKVYYLIWININFVQNPEETGVDTIDRAKNISIKQDYSPGNLVFIYFQPERTKLIMLEYFLGFHYLTVFKGLSL